MDLHAAAEWTSCFNIASNSYELGWRVLPSNPPTMGTKNCLRVPEGWVSYIFYEYDFVVDKGVS